MPDRQAAEEAKLEHTESSEELATELEKDTTLDEAFLKADAAKKEHAYATSERARLAKEAATLVAGAPGSRLAGIGAAATPGGVRQRLHTAEQQSKQSESATQGAGRVGQAEYDYAILHTPGFAATAGGIEPGGEAKQEAGASQRTYARNKELVASAVDHLVDVGVDRKEAREVAEGKKPTRTKTGADLDGSTDFPMRQAAIQQVVLTNDVAGMAQIWDSIADGSIRGTPEEIKTIRRTLAEAMFQAKAKPAWWGSGAIGKLEMGEPPKATNVLIKEAIDAGAYGIETIVTEDPDALLRIITLAGTAETAGGLNDEQRDKMQQVADDVLHKPEYATFRGKIKKNLANIERLAARNW
jgi:hypothetical protein